MKTPAILLIAVMATACTNKTHAAKVLHQAGYENVEMTGYRVFDCSEDDAVHDGFRATGPTGVMVTGVVCCGLIAKNCTVRLD